MTDSEGPIGQAPVGRAPIGQPPIGEDDLQAFIDGRLRGTRLSLVEAYLAAHPDIEKEVAKDRRHRESLRAQLEPKFAEPIPQRLRIASLRAARWAKWNRRLPATAAAVVLFAAGAGSGFIASRLQFDGSLSTPARTTMAVARDASTAYKTFVVEVVHPVEVNAANEAHLLQWLSKRLGRPLKAPDLARFGYRLMGGRLLPGGSGAAAQFMYDDASGKRLTVYVQAGQNAETAFRFKQDGDASTFAWIDQGFGFAVTAIADRGELLPIAEAIYTDFDGDDPSTPKKN